MGSCAGWWRGTNGQGGRGDGELPAGRVLTPKRRPPHACCCLGEHPSRPTSTPPYVHPPPSFPSSSSLSHPCSCYRHPTCGVIKTALPALFPGRRGKVCSALSTQRHWQSALTVHLDGCPCSRRRSSYCSSCWNDPFLRGASPRRSRGGRFRALLRSHVPPLCSCCCWGTAGQSTRLAQR